MIGLLNLLVQRELVNAQFLQDGLENPKFIKRPRTSGGNFIHDQLYLEIYLLLSGADRGAYLPSSVISGNGEFSNLLIITS